jgi:hypothetical protein
LSGLNLLDFSVRVYDHRGRASGDDCPGELPDLDHRALDVNVAVDEARRDVLAPGIDLIAAPVFPDAHDLPVKDADIALIDLARKDVHDVAAFENQVARELALGDLDYVCESCHSVPLCRTGSMG